MENRRTQEERTEEASNQLEALTYWFAVGKNADSFRRNALAEVDKVVRRATALASAARPSANYAANLNSLAHQLLLAKDGEAAQQLFSVAFANTLPVHLPESLAGPPSATHKPDERATWQEPATVRLRLRPVSRFNRGEPPLEDPIIDNRTLLRSLVAQHEAKLQERLQRFAHLFRNTLLDIGTFEIITPEDRAILTEVIDGCLGDTYHQYRVPDGSMVVLLNFFFQAEDGIRDLTVTGVQTCALPISWRGLMIDSARHFTPLDVIRRNLDGMDAVKMNVFHWHLSDNQGFRVESKRFPKLQERSEERRVGKECRSRWSPYH